MSGRYSLDSEWSFHLGDIPESIGNSHDDIYGTSKAGSCPGVPQASYISSEDGGWRTVDLPHDWSVTLPFDPDGSPSWGYKPKGRAWYRKQFLLGDEFKDKRLTIEFDGVAKDCEVYFNGSLIKRHFSAYTPFSADITDRAHFGKDPNVLAVYVNADGWEGWWYEGAGIYRHVRLISRQTVSIAQYGIFVCPQKLNSGEWDCPVEITVENSGYQTDTVTAECEIRDLSDNSLLLSGSKRLEISAQSRTVHTFGFKTDSPKLWDTDTPNLYECTVRLDNGEQQSVKFGFRTLCFDAQKGFFLNGRSVKLLGSCNHQDHGGIGVAIPDSVHEYRIKRLKEMGTNAYRCAHGMPHAELLDICDREGMLVMDENRSFETSDEGIEALRTMVLRDRNHPSVIMWSIFNEEPLQGTAEGMKMAQRMRFEINRLDPSRFVTGAMNGGVESGESAAQAVDVAGMNYQLYNYDIFHEKYPHIPVVGTETTSAFSVRGCYKSDYDRHFIACYDDESADWGNTVRETWQCIMARDFASGGFMWTGFDYLGEPTPFRWGSVSSYFGMMDVCGFAKDAFYLCKAIFSKQPVIHLLPHWNFKEGEKVTVMSCTNCQQAELFVNGVSQGKKDVDKLYQQRWDADFVPGEIKLVGYNDGKAVCEAVRKTADQAAELNIECANVSELKKGGLDCAIVNFTAVDKNGVETPLFCEKMRINISGGTLVGAANGDPTCHEPFDSPVRSLFNGKAQAIIRPFADSESLTISAECGKLKCKECVIPLTEVHGVMPSVKTVKETLITGWRVSPLSENKPDPLIRYADNDMNSLAPYTPKHGDGSLMSGAIGKYALFRAYADIPEKLNGQPPIIHFEQLWGSGEVWINGSKVLEFDSEWPVSAQIHGAAASKRAEITVIVKCLNKYGGGITSNVLLR